MRLSGLIGGLPTWIMLCAVWAQMAGVGWGQQLRNDVPSHRRLLPTSPAENGAWGLRGGTERPVLATEFSLGGERRSASAVQNPAEDSSSDSGSTSSSTWSRLLRNVPIVDGIRRAVEGAIRERIEGDVPDESYRQPLVDGSAEADRDTGTAWSDRNRSTPLSDTVGPRDDSRPGTDTTRGGRSPDGSGQRPVGPDGRIPLTELLRQLSRLEREMADERLPGSGSQNWPSGGEDFWRELLKSVDSIDSETAMQAWRDLQNDPQFSDSSWTSAFDEESGETEVGERPSPPASTDSGNDDHQLRQSLQDWLRRQSEGRESGGEDSKIADLPGTASGDGDWTQRMVESMIRSIDENGKDWIQELQRPENREKWRWIAKHAREAMQRLRRESKGVAVRPARQPRSSGSSSWRVPSVPGFNAPGALRSPLEAVLMWLTLVTLLLLFGYIMWRGDLWNLRSASRVSVRRPIPDIVDRRSLVDAVHAVAGNRLGSQVEYWNHHELFDRWFRLPVANLAEDEVPPSLLIELSGIYERARYARPEFHLTADQLDQARLAVADLNRRTLRWTAPRQNESNVPPDSGSTNTEIAGR